MNPFSDPCCSSLKSPLTGTFPLPAVSGHTVTAGQALAYKLSDTFKLGLSSYPSSENQASTTKQTLAQITATLAAAKAKEKASYATFGALAETKAAVQSAVMWQLIYNPIEAGPLAPVIRGNPWGLDKVHILHKDKRSIAYKDPRCGFRK